MRPATSMTGIISWHTSWLLFLLGGQATAHRGKLLFGEGTTLRRSRGLGTRRDLAGKGGAVTHARL